MVTNIRTTSSGKYYGPEVTCGSSMLYPYKIGIVLQTKAEHENLKDWLYKNIDSNSRTYIDPDTFKPCIVLDWILPDYPKDVEFAPSQNVNCGLFVKCQFKHLEHIDKFITEYNPVIYELIANIAYLINHTGIKIELRNPHDWPAIRELLAQFKIMLD